MDSLYHNQAQVDIIVGGSFQDYALISTADVVAVFDALQEIEQIPDRSNLIKVILGSGDTVRSLLTRLSQTQPDVMPLLEEYLHERANVHLGSGMAQDPRIGGCAIRDLDLRGELEPIFEEIYIRVMEACNAKLELLVLSLFASTAGGMGAGGASEIGDRFCAYMSRYTAAKIRRRTLRIGGLTYLSLSPFRIRKNTEETSQGDLQFMDYGPMSVMSYVTSSSTNCPCAAKRAPPCETIKYSATFWPLCWPKPVIPTAPTTG